MSKLGYYFRRARSMPKKEVARLGARKLLNVLHDSRMRFVARKANYLMDEKNLCKLAGVNNLEELEHKVQQNFRFFFDDNTEEQIVELLKRKYPENVRACINRANRIRNTQFEIFHHKYKFKDDIDWHLDFISGRRWPLEFYKEIEIITFDDSSDIKVVWELSRCHHFVTLGRAYAHTKNENYAKAFVDQLNSWIMSNPVFFGPNWVIAMEPSIRAVNWIWAYHFFRDSKIFDRETRTRFFSALYWHAEFIINNIEYAGKESSNHYLSNGIGLIYLGLFLPFKKRKKWLDKGMKIILDSMRNQVLDDGVDHERAIAYHRLVAEFFLHAYLLCKLNGINLPKWFEKKLGKMMEFIAYYTKPNGTAPNVGDDDSGRLIFLDDTLPLNDHRHLISTWAVLKNCETCRYSAKQLSEETIWLIGTDAYKRFQKVKQKAPESKAFKQGGFFVIRDKDVYLFIDCGPLGIGKRGGHGHNDVLSFELNYKGKDIVVDSGTYCYSKDYRWRNYFRSTRAHNTILIDDEELAPFPEKDLWFIEDITEPKLLKWKISRDGVVFEGMHKGYERIGVVHRRKITYEKGRKRVIVEDFIEGKGEHEITFPVHLHPNVKVIKQKTNEFLLSHEEVNVVVKTSEDVTSRIEQSRYSAGYGLKTRNRTISIHTRRMLPYRMETIFELH